MLGNEYAMNNQSEDDNNYSSQVDSRMGLNKGESFRTNDFDKSQNSNLQIARDKQGLKRQITNVIKGKDVESNKDYLAKQVLPIMIDSNVNINGVSVDPGHKTKVSISDSSEITLFGGENPNKPFNHKTYYDYDSFPQSSGHSCLPWTDFTRDFLSLDKKIDKQVEHSCT